MVPASSHKVSRVSWYSGYSWLHLDFGYKALTSFGLLFQNSSPIFMQYRPLSEPRNARIPVWALPRSLAATYGIDVSFFSSGYLDVSVRRVPSVNLWIQLTVTEVCSAGFPHSEICVSKGICTSPQLFSAYYVLHRLSVPRHPPYALVC